MLASLLAAAVALALGLPIFALGEYLRERKDLRLRNRHTSPNRKGAS